jgi:hypothetical protein
MPFNIEFKKKMRGFFFELLVFFDDSPVEVTDNQDYQYHKRYPSKCGGHPFSLLTRLEFPDTPN